MRRSLRPIPLRLALALSLFHFAIESVAEIPNKTAQELQESATLRSVGRIIRVNDSVEKRGLFEYTNSVAEVKNLNTEIGLVETNKTYYVHFWSKKWTGEGVPEPGDYGHRNVPKTGDVVRVYAMKQPDGKFDVISPNGFDILSARHGVKLNEVVDEEIWFDVFTDFTPLDAWGKRWNTQVKELNRIGGCDCHTAQFEVRATRAAIYDFPNRYWGFDGIGRINEKK